MVTSSEHSCPSNTHPRLFERDSRPPISSKSADIDRVESPSRNRELNFLSLGDGRTPVVDMFATVSNSRLPQFMSPIPEPRALAVDALSQDW